MKRINFARIYGWFTALALTAAAVCLCVQCVGIYRTGEFTPDRVAAAFRPIAPAVYLALVLALGSIPMAIFTATAKEKAVRCKPTALPKPPALWLRYALLGAAIALIVMGCLTGGTLDVLTKAVNICTECVGLG